MVGYTYIAHIHQSSSVYLSCADGLVTEASCFGIFGVHFGELVAAAVDAGHFLGSFPIRHDDFR